MTPPNPSNLSALKGRGAQLLLYHGTADAHFSSDDSTNRYDALRTANSGDTSDFAHDFPVPATWTSTPSRPLCPYPQVARYKCSGSIEWAENLECC